MNDRKPSPDDPEAPKPKIRTDGPGRTVWDAAVDEIDLDLVSSQSLKVLLESDNPKSRRAVENIARSNDQGLLARDSRTGEYQILEISSLDELMNTTVDTPTAPKPKRKKPDFVFAPEPAPTADTGNSGTSITDPVLQIVDTQLLRKMLDDDLIEHGRKPEFAGRRESDEGFDPYNSSPKSNR